VGRVFRGADAVAAGLLTPDQLRSTAWRRVVRGVYVDASLPAAPEHRLLAVELLAPPSVAFAGRTAAWLHGVDTAWEDRHAVEVAVPRGDRWGPVAGVLIHHVELPEEQVVVLAGHRVTSAVRTAADVARSGPPAATVPVLDPLLATTGVRATEVYVAVGSGRGCADARDALTWADRRAESPQESRLRLVLWQAGLRPVSQHVVLDQRGRFVARVDLAFPQQRVAVEYDGAWHAADGQFARDRRRLNALQAAGWRVLHVTAADLRRPEELVARLLALLAG
jgi:very-short-patch-repair endonuclease